MGLRPPIITWERGDCVCNFVMEVFRHNLFALLEAQSPRGCTKINSKVRTFSQLKGAC